MPILISALMDNYYFVLQESHSSPHPASFLISSPTTSPSTLCLPHYDHNLMVCPAIVSLPPPNTTLISSITLPVAPLSKRPCPHSHGSAMHVFQFPSGTPVLNLCSQLHHKYGSASASTQQCPPERHTSQQEAQFQGSFRLQWL